MFKKALDIIDDPGSKSPINGNGIDGVKSEKDTLCEEVGNIVKAILVENWIAGLDRTCKILTKMQF